MGFRNSFGSVMGQSEEEEWQSLQQTGGETTTGTTPKKKDDTDWADLIASGFESAGKIYGSYTKEQIAKISKETEEIKRRQQMTPGGMISPPSGGGISPNTLFIAGAVGVVGIILAITLR